MKNFLEDMAALNLQKRSVALICNGSWAPQAGPQMAAAADKMKDTTKLSDVITIVSSLNDATYQQLEQLADTIADSLK